jgi:hypothetical protein
VLGNPQSVAMHSIIYCLGFQFYILECKSLRQNDGLQLSYADSRRVLTPDVTNASAKRTQLNPPHETRSSSSARGT